MQRLTFVVPGPPVAWHRPQQTSRTGRIDGRGVRTYKHSDDRRYQKAVSTAAIAALRNWRSESDQPWDATGEWALGFSLYVHDLRRRDLDRLVNNIMDGLIGTVYDDDSQVCGFLPSSKRLDRKQPRCIITVHRIEGHLAE